jgi:hypothetical protein
VSPWNVVRDEVASRLDEPVRVAADAGAECRAFAAALFSCRPCVRDLTDQVEQAEGDDCLDACACHT